MDSPFLGSLFWFAGNFAPRGFFQCAGQLLPIAQYTALFSLLGTYYGGNGTSTFALPDLRGRTPIGAGQGAGLADYVLGEETGSESVTLAVSQLPAHTHALMAANTSAGKPHPGANHTFGPSTHKTYSTGAVDTTFGPTSIAPAGGNTPIGLVKPFVTLTACIAFSGVYPARN